MRRPSTLNTSMRSAPLSGSRKSPGAVSMATSTAASPNRPAPGSDPSAISGRVSSWSPSDSTMRMGAPSRNTSGTRYSWLPDSTT